MKDNMKTSITLRNLVNAIDKIVLKLKKSKTSKNTLEKDLIDEISFILNFISESKTEVYSNESYTKAIYNKKEELEIFSHDVKEVPVTLEEIGSMIKTLPKLKGTDIEKINEIQSLLIKVSVPIWKSRQIIFND